MPAAEKNLGKKGGKGACVIALCGSPAETEGACDAAEGVLVGEPQEDVGEIRVLAG